MKHLDYNQILCDYEAQEIAEDLSLEDDDELTAQERAAKTWFSEVIPEGEYVVETSKPTHSRWVCNLDDGWELYFDYCAGYYFAINECEEVVEEYEYQNS